MTSSLQQEIFDWIQTLPPWQQDLARRLAINDRLTAEEVDEVLELMLDDAPAAGRACLLEMEDLPSEQGAAAPVRLRALGDVQNINRLAPGQRLRFAPGLNVVYGDTGAGKSGLTRLLRHSCRSVKPGDVLPNVFGPAAGNGKQTARIFAKAGEENVELELDLDERPPRLLSSISVFDAACARVYVSEDNQIDFVPRPLVLFDRMVRAQVAITARLRERSDALAGPVPDLDGFSPETEAGQLVANLSAAGAVERATALAVLSERERTELQRLSEMEADLSSQHSAALEAAARRGALALQAARAALGEALQAVGDDAIAQARTIHKSREETIAAQRQLVREALADAPVRGTGEGSWKLLWDAAKRFAASAGSAFPDVSDDARCGLCQQELGEQARRRFVAFEQFVCSDLEERLTRLRRRAASLLEQAPEPPALGARVQASLAGIDDDEVAAETRAALSAYASRCAALTAWLSEEQPAGRLQEPLQPLPGLKVISGALDAQAKLAASHAELRDEQKRRELLGRLAELRDRVRLAGRLDMVRERVEQLRRREQIAIAMRQLDSQSISFTQRKLGMQGITSDLRAALANELSRLTPYSLRVTVAGSVRKGQIVVRVKLDAKHCADGVAQVLSDGEQRVLSLAFFLAELAAGTNRSAIVLDDPVTSLDQARREYVAQRLVGESRDRQVIVFTNDLAFLRLLQSQARSEGVSCHGQTLLRAGEEVGIVNGEIEPELPGRHKPELHSVPDIAAARRGLRLDAVTSGITELVELS
ncbi:MAG: hypothetical protein ACHQCH_05830 [Solirubrobacterales bacterium]